MFEPEEKAWTSKVDFIHSFKVPGLSPMYPNVHCVDDYSICLATTGEGEINAASSISFLVSSPKFNFSKTYWLLAGIAGGEPTQVTTGSVTFAKYAIQIGLQYQVDSREIQNTHPDWPSGYFSFGAKDPWEYPDSVYGTEIFELNENLRDRAMQLAQESAMTTKLSIGDVENINLRALFGYSPAIDDPQIVACDVLTSDSYFTGDVLSEYFGNFTSLLSNGTATYCSTAQEDNASLASFLRVSEAGFVDFERIIVLRTISNFARSPPSLRDDPVEYFLNYPKGTIQHSLDNLYIGGWPFVKDVVENWHLYEDGTTFKAENYVGDIFGTLGGVPDFGKNKYHIS